MPMVGMSLAPLVATETIATPTAIDKPKKFVKIRSVAVESNEIRPLNSTLALGFYPWVSTEGRAKWLFFVFTASVLHTIVVSLHGLLGRKHRTQVHPL
jgi:hypothetical protein